MKDRASIQLYNEDCLPAMRLMADNEFDLAIVDPPYGIGAGRDVIRHKYKEHKKGWDDSIPTKEYFNELIRVSINQIIWGGNYFELQPSQGFIIWDKKQPFDFSSSMCEYAWISMQRPAKIYNKHVVTSEPNKIHPTQKPRDLYKFLLTNYAKQGDKILDTHLGSGSIALACWDLGFDLTGYEIDKEYYDGAVKRLNNHKAQIQLF